METLGFCHPQFSEDLAWVPCWVQHQVEQFGECANGYLGSPKLKSKVPTLFQGDIFTGNDGGHNSQHLFLSGDDYSANSFTSASRNMLQVHLHLSSNGVSQCTPSSLGASDPSRSFSGPDKVLPMHNFEAKQDNNLLKASLGGANVSNIIPQNSSPEQRPTHPANSVDPKRHNREKLCQMRLKDAEIKEAVELSILASEALVIHEVLMGRLGSEELASTDALEVSLRMKQARLQWLNDAFDLTKEIDETDSFSDLDDFAMTDAFEDVGLIFCTSDNEESVSDSFSSHVKETPVGQPSQQVNCDDVMTQKRSETIPYLDGELRKDFHLESPKCERQRGLSGIPKKILKAFTRETSYLSESADIASDEDSVNQICEINSHAESQLSKAVVEDLLDEESNKILFSQDVVRSPSLLDPLCSVVPCSLSTEDIEIAEAQKHDNIGTDMGSDTRPEVESVKTCKISSLVVEIECGEEKSTGVDDKYSEGVARKHKTFLQTYHTYFPSSVVASDKEIIHCNQSFQSQYEQLVFDQSKDCIGASYELSSKHLPPFASTSKCQSGSEYDEFHLDEEPNKKKASYEEPCRDGSDTAIHSSKEETKPRLLHPTIRRRLRASKPSSVSFSSGRLLKQSDIPQSIPPIYRDPHNRIGGAKKRVRFSEPEDLIKQSSIKTTCKNINYLGKSISNCCSKEHMLQGMQFLVTGLSRQSGKDIIGKIQKHGGVILPDIPSPMYSMGSRLLTSNWNQHPIILSTRKQQTAKFLYGCAVNIYILHVDWLTDSIEAAFILRPEKYLILPWQAVRCSNIMNQVHENYPNGIFEKIGVMLYGKRSFSTKLEKIVKHGGGQVFKTVQRLVQRLNKQKISVGVIITEYDNMASRHLRHCATEWKIPIMENFLLSKSRNYFVSDYIQSKMTRGFTLRRIKRRKTTLLFSMRITRRLIYCTFGVWR